MNIQEIGIKNIITAIFVLAAIAGFLVFAGVIKIGDQSQQARGTVTLWGTIPYQTIQPYIDRIKTTNLEVIYSEKRTLNYETELINAFASGTGPDVFIMSHEGLLRHRDKIMEIPYQSLPRVSYENTYIKQAELFLSDTGVTAFPLAVDPLIMYYNKPLINSAFILSIPEYWDEFIPFAQDLSEYSGTGETITSAVALGTYNNIEHAKAIISSLIMQNGNYLIDTNPTDNKKRSTLTLDETRLEQSRSALDFYTSFARFGTNTYSWNEALPQSQNAFIAGDLAVYFGRASEAQNIRNLNPNLDFGVALFPQIRDSRIKLTHGSMTGVAISKHSTNVNAALTVTTSLTSSEIAGELADDLHLAPARKDLLTNTFADVLKTLRYNSAIISRGWVDADKSTTDSIFANLIRNINSGALSIQNALAQANTDMNTMLNRTINTTISN